MGFGTVKFRDFRLFPVEFEFTVQKIETILKRKADNAFRVEDIVNNLFSKLKASVNGFFRSLNPLECCNILTSEIHGIEKHELPKKMFGVFEAKPCDDTEPLLKGMDDTIYIPMSRHTDIDCDAVMNCDKLKVLAYGDDCKIAIIKSLDNKKFFFLGHSEYDRDTLKNEYLRDLDKGLDIDEPRNYFVNGDVNRIDVKWRSTANLIYYNWLNYYVYQVTPYDPYAQDGRDE